MLEMVYDGGYDNSISYRW